MLLFFVQLFYTAFHSLVMTKICKDGEFFLIYFMPLYSYFLDAPPALFLLDFENNTMQYVGYAKGWFEYEIANGEFFIREAFVYKLTKES